MDMNLDAETIENYNPQDKKKSGVLETKGSPRFSV
jgi:hypothetical protein